MANLEKTSTVEPLNADLERKCPESGCPDFRDRIIILHWDKSECPDYTGYRVPEDLKLFVTKKNFKSPPRGWVLTSNRKEGTLVTTFLIITKGGSMQCQCG